MARTAQTDLAVLAALSVSPMTGYAVREAILTHLGSFWAESFGQIYPTLTRLAREGCVAAEAGDRAGSSVYSLTPAGREKLVSLMSVPTVDVPPRNGLLLRLFFGNVLGAAACRSLVLEARDRAEVRLAELTRIRTANEDQDESVHSPYWSITLSAGEHSARAAIAWANETLTVLDTLPGA
jgi:DNA-binding PadR family transcriptional regulator